MTTKNLIFGKNSQNNIVSIGVKDGLIETFIEENGTVKSVFQKNIYWILSPKKLDYHFRPLAGNLHYKYIKTYDNEKSYFIERRKYQNEDIFYISDPKEASMVFGGSTYFKGMKVENVSALFFDIESVGLQKDENSKVLIIANTFVKNGIITRKMFCYDDFPNEMDLFDAWASWVLAIDPSIIGGHNIFGYDLPYLQHCAEKAGTTLPLGRDGSNLYISKRESEFRKDGSQGYKYFRSYIYGREIVDTMFVSYHFDFARKYESYALKNIIKQEGLEQPGRVFYDAGKISENYKIPEEWAKIKEYAKFDADDAYSLYKLMIPAYFYLNQTIPKTFQQINYSASGSQINAFLIRSYLQIGHSLPKASLGQSFEGAISIGNPGKYKNVFKIDVASLYPSIMLQYDIYDREKDPQGHFIKMVDYFTTERLNNKKQGQIIGNRYFKELEQAQKIIINSAYGMLGAHGLLFNSPKNAELVTKYGREILQKALDFAIKHHFIIVNADTDSIAITFDDMSEISENIRVEILEEVNKMYPEKIRWENDGMYEYFLTLKAKNYVLDKGKYFNPKKDKPEDKRKIKGSALKSSKTEPALKAFMGEIIEALLNDKENTINEIYKKYIKEVYNLKSIGRWCSKKTITEKVLNPERTNEQKVLDAIDVEDVQMGDKMYFFFSEDGSLKLEKNWKQDHNKDKLCEKLYKTLKIFQNVLDMNKFNNYKLKKNKQELQNIINGI